MMLGKLTWTRCGLMLLAGLAGSACSEEARKPVEVGAAQVELRSDLVYPETPGSSTVLLAEESPGHPGKFANPMPAAQRAVRYYGSPPALLNDPKTRKSSVREDDIHTNSWTLANKPWVRGGKGFGVAAEDMAPLGSVHLDDASYYFPTVPLKPHSKASESMEPIARPFKSRKPLVFHSGATGFAHEPPVDAALPEYSAPDEAQPVLSPIPETQIYLSSKPKTHVTLAPGKNRLDMMKGNQNLNRHRFHQHDAGPDPAEAK